MVDAGIEAMTFMKQLMDDQGGYENSVAFSRGLTLGEGIDAFSANKVGLAMNGTWVLKNYDRYSPDLDYGMTSGPVFEDVGIPSNYDGGQCWFVFRSDKIAESLKFAQWRYRLVIYLFFWYSRISCLPSCMGMSRHVCATAPA